MESEKLAPKKRKKSSKRSRSSSSSGEDDKSKRKRRLNESKASLQGVKRSGSKCSLDNDECKTKNSRKKTKRRKRGKGNAMKKNSESEETNSRSSLGSEQCKKKKQKEKKKKKRRKKKKQLKNEQQKVGKVKNVNSADQNDLDEVSHEKEEDLLPGPKPEKSAEEPKRRAMVPMTKEEYDQQQSKIRRVFDPDTGRERLIKGEGEIVEEAVSYGRHKAINKLATVGDGAAFQKSLGLNRYTDDKVYSKS